MALNRKHGVLLTGAAAAVLLTAGTIGVAAASAQPAGGAQQQPPRGARAVVHVSPNPTTERGQEITITGNCGGGRGLKTVIGNSPDHPSLVNIRILDRNPAGFLAKANVGPQIGNGVGPVLVDCGGEAGVTLLVTRVG
ncbi:hypothetical protein [Amycolatopsis sp. PS_44_ISF1]|uniref:hypothetical protein n=1 Tax=Amycolatopsis sp. PS_44_ISF1 TaxID=2974917 RepID=UPI0028DDD4E9|nr:hypothetical protein [Amycolatopsis sp. PS_44_ISF1]MDT8915310.1 hypothetical protein [Amycolatopsis sp. PS_44_ISF1]